MNAIARCFFIAFVLLGPSAQAENLILNGGFESPAIGDNSREVTAPTSWNAGSFNVIVNGNGSVSELPFPLSGQQYNAIATTQSLSQVFTVVRAAEYTLQWSDSSPHPGDLIVVPYTVNVISASSDIVVNAAFDAFHPEEWLRRSLKLELTPGDYTLRFTAGGTVVGGNAPLFDDISVVPEPSAAVLLLLTCLVAPPHRFRV